MCYHQKVLFRHVAKTWDINAVVENEMYPVMHSHKCTPVNLQSTQWQKEQGTVQSH